MPAALPAAQRLAPCTFAVLAEHVCLPAPTCCTAEGPPRPLPLPPAPRRRAEGATFLLPLLLQVSDPAFGSAGGERRREEHQLWLDALASPATLQQLVQYVAACAAGCAPAVTAAAVAAADHALINACHLLMNLVSPGPAAQQQQPAAAPPSCCGGGASCWPPAARCAWYTGCCSWRASARWCPGRLQAWRAGACCQVRAPLGCAHLLCTLPPCVASPAVDVSVWLAPGRGPVC